MEAHCSTGAPCGTVKEASFFYLRNRCHVVFKKKPHRVFSLRIYFLLLKYSTFTPERQYNPRKFLFFSIFTDCAFLRLYNMFKAFVSFISNFLFGSGHFIYFDRAFYDSLRTQSATLQQNSPFLLRFPVFAQLFVSHAPVCGGAWRLGGRLVGGMAGLRRTVPVFLRRDGYTAPLQTVCGVCGGGCVFGGLHARQQDAVLPLQRGAGLLQICHSLFCPPCPAPDSRFPLADFYLRQLLRCI